MAIPFIIGLLLYFSLIGFYVVSILSKSILFKVQILISPFIGISTLIVILFTYSRLGFAINHNSYYIFFISLFVPIVYILFNFFKKKDINYKFLNLFWLLLIPILPYAFVLFDLGFNWIAFVNGDFSFYSLSASRFQNYGYSELPLDGNLLSLKDHSLFYWNFTNTLGHRAGSEILLAYISSISLLNVHEIFMSLSLAAYSSFVFALATFVLQMTRSIIIIILFIIFCSLSPVLGLPVILQLFAQILGLGHLTLAVILFYYVIRYENKGNVFVFGIVFMGLTIVYSEFLPFLLLFLGVYIFYKYKRVTKKIISIKHFFIKLIVFLTVVIVCLNTYIIEVFEFIKLVYFVSQESHNMAVLDGKTTLFPLFLTPGIFPFIFNLLPYGFFPKNIHIVLSLLVLIIFLFFFFKKIKKIQSNLLLIFIIIIIVGNYLFFKNHSYGMFKIAMMIQPFLLAVAFTLFYYYKNTNVSKVFFIVLLILFTFKLSENIKKVSKDIGISPVPYASTQQYVKELKNIKQILDENNVDTIISDTDIREFYLLQSYYFKGIDFLAITSSSFSKNLDKINIDKKKIVSDEVLFNFKDDYAKFQPLNLDTKKNIYVLISPKEGTILNRAVAKEGKKVYIEKYSDVQNHLVFKQTSLGTSTVGNMRTMFQIEADPIFGYNNIFAGIGRYHLYQILNYQKNSKLLFWITASYNEGENYKLPKVKIFGTKEYSLDTVGSGSARVVTDIVTPLTHKSEDYIGVDFAYHGSYFGNNKPILMNIFNNKLLIDPRKISLFARNISLIDSSGYEKVISRSPSIINKLPQDLANENLIYSGIFEDGWVSDEFYVNLAKKDASKVNIKGVIPNFGNVNFVTDIEVLINGISKLVHKQSVGEFELTVPLDNINSEIYNIHIKCSNVQIISKADPRLVSFLIKEIKIKEKDEIQN